MSTGCSGRSCESAEEDGDNGTAASPSVDGRGGEDRGTWSSGLASLRFLGLGELGVCDGESGAESGCTTERDFERFRGVDSSSGLKSSKLASSSSLSESCCTMRSMLGCLGLRLKFAIASTGLSRVNGPVGLG